MALNLMFSKFFLAKKAPILGYLGVSRFERQWHFQLLVVSRMIVLFLNPRLFLQEKETFVEFQQILTFSGSIHFRDQQPVFSPFMQAN